MNSAPRTRCPQALRDRRAAVLFVAFFAVVFLADCCFAVFFFGSSWTPASTPREA
ncbi:putative secreted protein [Streptomyces avermitilis MA-4680 = NBRC 14893]|uniref:Secreted protein n=1 Tax=Streptomyces avermitilis (strain ATCC 31267 / DSM 46492 / JCM 5070 / NBRC 14893 / NCIMB 12804 / NRRL 8165 / MA-4680) TaxID=227882 RepID=Q82RX5_STRAW|nr:putative secreted protein [Streptomyces avermitilis MA-4680 = NBRC 14893]